MTTKKTKQTRKPEKQVVWTKEYTLKTVRYNDGSTTVFRNNTGYSITELLGWLTIIKDDLMEIMKGSLHPINAEIIRTSTDVSYTKDTPPETTEL
jgi:hypothetical protein